MLPEDQLNTYKAFYTAAEETPVLDPRTTLLVQMAVAMAIGCGP